jgi:hypothetical protein
MREMEVLNWPIREQRSGSTTCPLGLTGPATDMFLQKPQIVDKLTPGSFSSSFLCV